MPVRSATAAMTSIALLAALALAVAPAVLVAATNPRFSATPFSAVMVFLGLPSPMPAR